MSFQLSKRSISRLKGVKPELVRVVHRAIEITKVDFGVTEGLRTTARQRQLVAQGKSQTMNSKHITGDAVDVVAYLGSKVTWNIELYDEIADAFARAGRELGVPLRWGAAWSIDDITRYNGTMEQAMLEYVDLRRSQGRRPFIDAVHLELS